jgi:3',5'-cyclic-AMP phosphodiesterase
MENSIMSKKIATIIQITDNHLLGDQNKLFLGVNTFLHLKSIITDINQKITNNEISKPDLVVFSGDISQDFSNNSYQLFLQASESISYKIVAIPGNHDDLNLFRSILDNTKIDIKSKHFIFSNWQIVLLNSHWPFHVAGFIEKNELDFLDATLKSHRQKSALIFVHHHILPVNEAWLDRHILKNNDEFLNVVDKYDNIKSIVSGHIHQENEIIRNNVKFISTPATAFQFAKETQTFKLDTLMPGYRVFNFFTDDTFTTNVFRLPQNDKFIPDLNCSGY